MKIPEGEQVPECNLKFTSAHELGGLRKKDLSLYLLI
jgi:hypothetical protein